MLTGDVLEALRHRDELFDLLPLLRSDDLSRIAGSFRLDAYTVERRVGRIGVEATGGLAHLPELPRSDLLDTRPRATRGRSAGRLLEPVEQRAVAGATERSQKRLPLRGALPL